MSKITVFGIMVADMVVEVDDFPLEGETILGKSINTYLGGKGFNQAVAASRLGGDVEFIGSIGNDNNGENFLNVLKNEKMVHDRILINENIPTGVAQIQVNKMGQNKIIVIPAANHLFTEEILLENADVFNNTEIAVFQLEMLKDVTFKAIEMANKKGVKVILNPAPVPEIPAETLSLVDYLIPNEVELELLTNIKTNTIEGVKKASEVLLKLGVKNVITTLGSKGAFIANENTMLLVEGFKASKVVDTVAAGDSFIGGFTVMIQEGKTIIEATKFANAVGSLTVQVKGALPSLHKRADVLKVLETK